MADPRFFTNAGPFQLARIIDRLGIALPAEFGNVEIRDVAGLEQAGPGDLTFLARADKRQAAGLIAATAVLVTERDRDVLPANVIALVVANPHLAYAQIAAMFYPDLPGEAAIHPTASVDPSAKLGGGVRIDAQAVIGAGAEIGAGSVIGAGTVIGAGVVLGCDCRVGPNCSISHTIAGDRLTTLPGARIGQAGFGFLPGPKGVTRIPQLGRVVLGHDVEVGANSAIDRGAVEDTVIGDGTMIDNLVQVGHNVRIGRGCILVAQVGVSGSTKLGDYVALGGQVGVSGHLDIGSGARVAAQSGVIRSMPAGAEWGGYPAVPVRQWHRQTATLARMTRKKGE